MGAQKPSIIFYRTDFKWALIRGLFSPWQSAFARNVTVHPDCAHEILRKGETVAQYKLSSLGIPYNRQYTLVVSYNVTCQFHCFVTFVTFENNVGYVPFCSKHQQDDGRHSTTGRDANAHDKYPYFIWIVKIWNDFGSFVNLLQLPAKKTSKYKKTKCRTTSLTSLYF